MVFNDNLCFFFNDTATTEIYTYLHTLSLHDARPIYLSALCRTRRHTGPDRHPGSWGHAARPGEVDTEARAERSEEHTSELQSLMRISYAVFCLKKKNYTNKMSINNTQIELITYQLYKTYTNISNIS